MKVSEEFPQGVRSSGCTMAAGEGRLDEEEEEAVECLLLLLLLLFSVFRSCRS